MVNVAYIIHTQCVNLQTQQLYILAVAVAHLWSPTKCPPSDWGELRVWSQNYGRDTLADSLILLSDGTHILWMPGLRFVEEDLSSDILVTSSASFAWKRVLQPFFCSRKKSGTDMWKHAMICVWNIPNFKAQESCILPAVGVSKRQLCWFWELWASTQNIVVGSKKLFFLLFFPSGKYLQKEGSVYI